MAFVTEVWKCLWVSGWRGVAGSPHTHPVHLHQVGVGDREPEQGRPGSWMARTSMRKKN